MARTVTQIYAQMVADVQASPILSILVPPAPQLPSKRSIWGALLFVFATCTFLLESLIDVAKAEVEDIANSAAWASPSYLQNKMLQFQYDPVTPQIVQLINYVPQYPVVDPTKQIISRVSVVTTVAGQTLVKLATGTPPGALNSDELSAAQDYLDTIGATIKYIATSQAADHLDIGANIYYAGQFSAIIQESVIDAITNLLSTFSSADFDGTLKVSDIEQVILGVPGVNDVILTNVIARQDATPFADGTYLVQNQQLISRTWATVAGYIIPETTSGQTLTDSLTFIAQ